MTFFSIICKVFEAKNLAPLAPPVLQIPTKNNTNALDSIPFYGMFHITIELLCTFVIKRALAAHLYRKAVTLSKHHISLQFLKK